MILLNLLTDIYQHLTANIILSIEWALINVVKTIVQSVNFANIGSAKNENKYKK